MSGGLSSPHFPSGKDHKTHHQFNFLDNPFPDSQDLPQDSNAGAAEKSTACESNEDCLDADCTNIDGQGKHCICYTTGLHCPNRKSMCQENCGPEAYCSMQGCLCRATDKPPVDGVCSLGNTACHTDADCTEQARCLWSQGGKQCFCKDISSFCPNRHAEEARQRGGSPSTSTPTPDAAEDTTQSAGFPWPSGPDAHVPFPAGDGEGVGVTVGEERGGGLGVGVAVVGSEHGGGGGGGGPPRVGRLTTEMTNTTSDPPDVIWRDQIKDIINLHGGGSKSSSGSAGSSVLLNVVLPLGVLLFIGVLIVIICLRRQRQHRLGPKRGSEAVVKSADGVMLLDRMNNISKNPHYFASGDGDDNEGALRKFMVREICMDHIVLVDVVGEGAFGQVYRGEMHCPDTNSQQLVAVKVLKENVSNEIREDFEREVEIMSAFDHDNILKLVGVVSQNAGQSPYMIFEYMVHGDLAELLRKNDPSTISKETGVIRLQKADLVDIATQIANGMRYLTSQHFVHRDLATRNCLVGEGLVVKISDFGMSRDIYTCDYYKIGGSRMLPVRWMSPESVKYGKFTSESDAWAYGVVLWEIFSLGRQPYYGHSNEEVVRFLDAGILLQRPEDCPSTIYHIMLGCWKADPKERLSFDKIHKHLQDYHGRLVKMAAASQPTTPVANDDELETSKFPTVASSPEFPAKQASSPLQSKPLLKATQSDPMGGGYGKMVASSAPRRSSQTLGQDDQQQDCAEKGFQVKLPPLTLPDVSSSPSPPYPSPPCVEDVPDVEVTSPLTQPACSPPVKSNGQGSLIKLHAMDSGFSSGEQHWTVPELESSATTTTTTTETKGLTSPSLSETPPPPGSVVLEPLTSIVCTDPAEVV
ncbi:uncharacterized protein LOC143280886 isoform X2 [Babylonia areolata]|uniref:uncharacterized protein LOC143280886 isoform X2 n=1 Tax=Babylonia areolata TaxID=304850 RepID=UPI003FD3A5D1